MIRDKTQNLVPITDAVQLCTISINCFKIQLLKGAVCIFFSEYTPFADQSCHVHLQSGFGTLPKIKMLRLGKVLGSYIWCTD
jgi:hypothetical protein